MTSSSIASADAVTERVFLITGATGCPTGQTGFKRLKQTPDGAATTETTEFQVPAGWYLEITNIEYTTPHWTPWASTYVQNVDFRIVNRTGSPGYSVFSARYQNRPVFAWNGSAYDSIEEVSGPGAQNHVVAFPVGPLMSPAARLCVSTSSNFWNYGGSARVRGRLIPSNDISGGATTNAP